MDYTDEDEQSYVEEDNECSEPRLEYDKTSQADGREDMSENEIYNCSQKNRGMGCPLEELQGTTKRPFVPTNGSEKPRLDEFRHELKLLFVEINIITNWIAENFGIELIDKTSPLFKHIHESAEIDILTQALSLIEKKKSVRRSSRRKQIKTSSTPAVTELQQNSARLCRKQRIVLLDSKVENDDGHFQPHGAIVETGSQTTKKRRKTRKWSTRNCVKTEKEINFDETCEEDVRDDVDGDESTKELLKKKYIWKPATQPMQCDECGKILKGDSSLRCHMLMHADLRPYECTKCGKRFRNKTKLGQHALIHNAEKSEKCTFCGRGFLRKKDLIIHERTHTGEKPFSCNQCPKSFNIKEHLTIHLRVHTGEKPYRCEVCTKAFSQANSLRIHKKIHLKESTVDTKPKGKKPRMSRKRKRENLCQFISQEAEKQNLSSTFSRISKKEKVNVGHKNSTATIDLQDGNDSHPDRCHVTLKSLSSSKLRNTMYDYHHPKEEQSQTSPSQLPPPPLSLPHHQPQSTHSHFFTGHGPNPVTMTPEQHSILVQNFFQAQQNSDTPWHFTGTTSSAGNSLQEDNQRGTLSHTHPPSPHAVAIHHPHIVPGFKLQPGYPPPQQHNSVIRSGLTMNPHHHNHSNGLSINPFALTQYHDSGQAFRHFSH